MLIRVVFANVDDVAPSPAIAYTRETLPVDERDRLERLLDPADQARSLTARMLALRECADVWDTSPEHVPLWRDERGRLRLGLEGDLSVAHSGPWAVCAVTTQDRVGVDVERVSSVGDLAPEAFMSRSELAANRRSASAARRAAETWVAKEALLKMQGTGFTVDPRDVDLPGSLGDSVQMITTPDSDYVAAVCTSNGSRDRSGLSVELVATRDGSALVTSPCPQPGLATTAGMVQQ